MNQKQKIAMSLKDSLLVNCPMYICDYFSEGRKPTLLDILIVVAMGTIIIYVCYFVIFRYIAKNWLKWEEVQSEDEK